MEVLVKAVPLLVSNKQQQASINHQLQATSTKLGRIRPVPSTWSYNLPADLGLIVLREAASLGPVSSFSLEPSVATSFVGKERTYLFVRSRAAQSVTEMVRGTAFLNGFADFANKKIEEALPQVKNYVEFVEEKVKETLPIVKSFAEEKMKASLPLVKYSVGFAKDKVKESFHHVKGFAKEKMKESMPVVKGSIGLANEKVEESVVHHVKGFAEDKMNESIPLVKGSVYFAIVHEKVKESVHHVKGFVLPENSNQFIHDSVKIALFFLICLGVWFGCLFLIWFWCKPSRSGGGGGSGSGGGGVKMMKAPGGGGGGGGDQMINSSLSRDGFEENPKLHFRGWRAKGE